jgi:hypothetical protein
MDETRTMDRRRFVRLLAAGAAAAAAAPLAGTASAKQQPAAAPPKPAPTHRALTPSMRKEIDVQKKSVADMVKVIRAYELPAGSPPAPVFRAMRARRRER